MDCKTFNENLDLFVEHKLDKQTAEMYNKHLLECDNCRQNYIVMKLAVSDAAEHTPTKTYKFYWTAAAAAIIVLIGVYLYFNQSEKILNIADNADTQKQIDSDTFSIDDNNQTVIAMNKEIHTANKQDIVKPVIVFSGKLDSVSQQELNKIIAPYISDNNKLAFVKTAAVINPLVIIENYDKNIITVYNAPDLKRLFADSKNQIKQITETIKSEYLNNSEINGVINNIVDFEITEIIICEYKNKVLKFKKYR